jgi:hypothetical protein
MPIIDVPFQRVAVDLVGLTQPVTDRGNRYILTLVYVATRYPEAVALRGIETERVAEALVDIFCKIGVPKEMLSTKGDVDSSGIAVHIAANVGDQLTFVLAPDDDHALPSNVQRACGTVQRYTETDTISVMCRATKGLG